MNALATEAQPKFLTRHEVAQMFGVPEKTVAQWAFKGTGPKFYKIGRYARYKLSDCLEWAESREAA